MKIEKNYFFFKTLRVIFDDKLLETALRERRFSRITGISYNDFFGDIGVAVKEKKTVVIDLTKSEEKIFLGFNKTTRNEIRKIATLCEFCFVLPDNDTGVVYELYKDFERRGGRIVRGKRYFESSIHAGAYWNGNLIAAIIAYDTFPVIRINAIVSQSQEEFPERKYVGYGTRRLIFEFCKYGINRGYSMLDLGGVNLTEEGKSGITAFKMSFGGELKNEYTYTYKSPIFRFLQKLKL